MAHDPISKAYFINPSHQSACLYVYPSYRCYATAWYTCSRGNEYSKRRTVGHVVFYAVNVSKESLWICLCIPLSLQGNGSVNTFPRQWRIVGGVVFHAVRDVSKEIRRLVLPRKMKVGLCELHPLRVRVSTSICLCVCEFLPPIKFLMPEPVCMKLGISWHWAHLDGILHKSLPSVCVSLYISLLPLLGKGSVNTFPRQRKHATIPLSLHYVARSACGGMSTCKRECSDISSEAAMRRGHTPGGRQKWDKQCHVKTWDYFADSLASLFGPG
jgi:hypothetical protein